MRTRKLGNTNIELTIIGLGTFAMGGADWQYSWGVQDEKDSIDTIKKAIDMGVNWIDTAPAYGLGKSEEIVGKAVKGSRHKIIISTKCGFLWDDNRNLVTSLTRQSVRKELEDSLSRLQTDVIDLYQIHFPSEGTGSIEEAWHEISSLVGEGKIRYAGVSNFTVEQIEKISGIAPVAFIQPPYSMLNRVIEQDVLPYCEKNRVGIIVYSPLQKGLLTGAFSKQRVGNLPAGDHRINDDYFKEPRLSNVLEFVEKLKPYAQKNSVSLAQLALAWTLQKTAVTSNIVGARNPKQIEETVEAGHIDIPEEDMESINKMLDQYDTYMTG